MALASVEWRCSLGGAPWGVLFVAENHHGRLIVLVVTQAKDGIQKDCFAWKSHGLEQLFEHVESKEVEVTLLLSHWSLVVVSMPVESRHLLSWWCPFLLCRKTIF